MADGRAERRLRRPRAIGIRIGARSRRRGEQDAGRG